MLVTSLIFIKNTDLRFQKHCFDSRNPTEEEFLQFHLTSSHNTQNDENLDIFDSDSLHILQK